MKKQSIAQHPNHNNVAIFLNIDRSFKLRTIDSLMDALIPWGNVVTKKAFGNFSIMRESLLKSLSKHSFTFADTGKLSSYHNASQVAIAVEATEMACANSEINTFAISSDNENFISLIHRLKKHGKTVIGIGSKKVSPEIITNNCNAFIFLEDIADYDSEEENLIFSEEEIYTMLRKKKLNVPPQPERIQILEHIYKHSQKLSFPCTLGELQKNWLTICPQGNFSKNNVRNIIRCLLKSGFWENKLDVPTQEIVIKRLSKPHKMESAISQYLLSALLEQQNLVADPVIISRVIWGNSDKSAELEKIIARKIS